MTQRTTTIWIISWQKWGQWRKMKLAMSTSNTLSLLICMSTFNSWSHRAISVIQNSSIKWPCASQLIFTKSKTMRHLWHSIHYFQPGYSKKKLSRSKWVSCWRKLKWYTTTFRSNRGWRPTWPRSPCQTWLRGMWVPSDSKQKRSIKEIRWSILRWSRTGDVF